MKRITFAWLSILTSLTTFAADKPITGLTLFTGAPGTNDLIPFVNRSDLTQSTNGSTRSMTWSNLNRFLGPNFTANNFNSTQFGLNGATNVYIKSGSDQTNVLMFPSIAGNSSAAFYDTNFTVKASFDYLGNFSSSGNNTFTGTNNFTGAVIITNAGSTISGDGAGLTNISIPNNNIGIRLLWSSPTNIYIPKMYPADGVTTLSFTNNGLVNMATQWFSFTIPPLLGSNSQLVFSALRQTTNANQFNGNMAIYIGPNTNYIGYFQPFPTSSSLAQNFNFTSVLANCGSFTNQITIALSPASSGITNYFDSTVSNTVYVGFFLNGVTGYRSNDVLIGFCAQEVFRP